MSTNTILVTGGAGYIGSHTVQLLVKRGFSVVVLDNLVYGHREAITDASVELVVGSIGDSQLLDELFTKYSFSAVIHFAAYAYVGESVTDPLKYYRNNTAEPLALLEVMQKFGCKQFVFSSTCATYGVPDVIPITEKQMQNPINPYGRSKLMLEWVLADCEHAWGLHSVCLRYFNASGCSSDGNIGEDHRPETHLIPRVMMALNGEAGPVDLFGTDYPTPDGTCIRDYIHVEDLAEAHALALDFLTNNKESLRVNLGTGQGVSVQEIINAVEEVTGLKVPLRYADRRPGDPPQLVADPTLAAEKLGWKAKKLNISETVDSAWQWMNGPRKGRYND